MRAEVVFNNQAHGQPLPSLDRLSNVTPWSMNQCRDLKLEVDEVVDKITRTSAIILGSNVSPTLSLTLPCRGGGRNHPGLS